jgi:AmpD protein
VRTTSGGPPFDAEGRLLRALQIPSPNCDLRPAATQITLLVVHSISLPPGRFGGPAVIDFFLNRLDHRAHPYFEQIRGFEVSTHFFIRRSGELIQFVPCAMRAWHAGRSQWKGRERCNDFSIGVELEGTDDTTFSDSQYMEIARLTFELQRKYPIRDIVGHSDIAPGRKSDPGLGFDWARYRSMI